LAIIPESANVRAVFAAKDVRGRIFKVGNDEKLADLLDGVESPQRVTGGQNRSFQ
jgi:hypothetical protein